MMSLICFCENKIVMLWPKLRDINSNDCVYCVYFTAVIDPGLMQSCSNRKFQEIFVDIWEKSLQYDADDICHCLFFPFLTDFY